jgi:uncharacterized protein (DUF924 family)
MLIAFRFNTQKTVEMILQFWWEANLTSWLEKQTNINRMNYENR